MFVTFLFVYSSGIFARPAAGASHLCLSSERRSQGGHEGKQGEGEGQGEKGKNSLLFRDPAGEEGGGGGAPGEEEGREELAVGMGMGPYPGLIGPVWGFVTSGWMVQMKMIISEMEAMLMIMMIINDQEDAPGSWPSCRP